MAEKNDMTPHINSVKIKTAIMTEREAFRKFESGAFSFLKSYLYESCGYSMPQ